jgi:hypothetical protein
VRGPAAEGPATSSMAMCVMSSASAVSYFFCFLGAKSETCPRAHLIFELRCILANVFLRSAPAQSKL